MSLPLPMTFMSVSMERPLNQAHSQERVAENHLNHGRYDEAEHYFLLAAKLMREAMKDTSSAKMALPLQLQAEKLEKMKDIIDIKRRECESSEHSSNGQKFEQHQSPSRHPTLDKVQPEKQATVRHKALQVTSNNNSKPTKPSKSTANKPDHNQWQMVPKNVQQLIEERETDSLLQFLNFPIDDQHVDDPLNASPSRKKFDKNDATIIEEYKTRVNILQNTALCLVTALDETQKENQSLKQNIKELQDEVWNLTERLASLQGDGAPHSMHYHHSHSHEPESEFSSSKFTTDPMIASIIVQPESFFEFDRKPNNITSELQEAAFDDFPAQNSKSMPATRTLLKHSTKKAKQQNSNDPGLKPIDRSIKYEDLDDEANAEVEEHTFHSLSDVTVASDSSAQLRHISIAGLPPLSPVHFELDEKDDIL